MRLLKNVGSQMLKMKCMLYLGYIMSIFPCHVLINDIPLMYEYCAKVKERNDKLP